MSEIKDTGIKLGFDINKSNNISSKGEHKESKLNKDKLFEGIYLIYLLLISMFLIIDTTNIDFSKYLNIYKLLVIPFALLMLAKIGYEWSRSWKNTHILLALTGVCLLLPMSIQYEYIQIVYYIIAILAAKNVNYKKILGLVLILNVIALAGLTVLSLAGVVPNFVTYRKGSTKPRYSMGFKYTTYFSSMVMAVIAIYSFLRSKSLRIYEAIILFLLSFLTIFVSEGRIDFLTSLIISVFSILIIILREVKEDIVDKFFNNPFIRYCMILSAPILALVSFILAFLHKFQNDAWDKIDRLTSLRTYYNALTLKRYGFSVLGQYITNHCTIDDGTTGVPDYYYIINSSYFNIFAIAGILGILGIIVSWSILIKRQLDKKNYLPAIVLAAYSVLFFLEQRIFELPVNPFWLLLFCDDNLNDMKLQEKIEDNSEEHSSAFSADSINKNATCRVILNSIVLAVIAELLVFNYKSVVTMANPEPAADSLQYFSEQILYIESTDLFVTTEEIPQFYVSGGYSPSGAESLYIDLRLYTLDTYENYRVLNNTDYIVDVYSYLDGEYKYILSKHINTSNAASGYIDLPYRTKEQFVMLYFHLPENCQFDIRKIGFDLARPFDINYLRLFAMALIIAMIYSAVIFIKNRKSESSINDNK